MLKLQDILLNEYSKFKLNIPSDIKKIHGLFKKNNKSSTYASLEEVITICRKAVNFDLTFIQNINFLIHLNLINKFLITLKIT